MNSKRLLIQENIKRCLKAILGIKKKPVTVYTFTFASNGLDTKIERFNKFEQSFLESFFVKSLKKNLSKQLNKIEFVTQGIEFHFDHFEGLHGLKVNFNIISRTELSEVRPFMTLMKEICDEVIGGKVYISQITLDRLEDVFVRIFPISSLEDPLSFEDLSETHAFPSFYTKTFFDFIHEPIKVIYLS